MSPCGAAIGERMPVTMKGGASLSPIGTAGEDGEPRMVVTIIYSLNFMKQNCNQVKDLNTTYTILSGD
jgi:hypothetical protein